MIRLAILSRKLTVPCQVANSSAALCRTNGCCGCSLLSRVPGAGSIMPKRAEMTHNATTGNNTLSTRGITMLTPNHCMQPTPQTVIKFAYANLPPVWCAADAGC